MEFAWNPNAKVKKNIQKNNIKNCGNITSIPRQNVFKNACTLFIGKKISFGRKH